MKRLLWCSGMLLAFTSPAIAGGKAPNRDPNPRQITLSGGNRQHTFSVRLVSQTFQRSHHIISEKKYPPIIDGKQQEYMPEQELSRFTVTVDGKHWPVSAMLWRDSFDPILRASPDDQAPKTVLNRDGQQLWIKMSGGDGHGGYLVTWHLSAKGRKWRTVKYTGADD